MALALSAHTPWVHLVSMGAADHAVQAESLLAGSPGVL